MVVIVASPVCPVALAFGVDPIPVGLIRVMRIETGMSAPPVGRNLFVAPGVSGMAMMRVGKAALPFPGVLFTRRLVVTHVPILSTGMPTRQTDPEIIIRGSNPDHARAPEPAPGMLRRLTRRAAAGKMVQH